VLPSALLLRAIGDQQTLHAYLVDAAGIRTPVTPAWTSANPSAVSVTTGGVASAVVALGSSQITATANGRTSAPVLALVATPVDNALLITDEQVDGAVAPVSVTAPYGVGWRYHARIRDATPTVGQIVMTTGGLPIGGKVVSVTPATAGTTDVVLEVVPISSMFKAVSVAQHMPLSAVSADVAPAIQQTFAVSRSGKRLQFTPAGGKARFVISEVASEAAPGKVEFDIGPFACEAEVGVGASFPILLTVSSFSVTPTFGFDVVINGLVPDRMIVDGSMDVQFAAKPEITGSVAASISCNMTLAQLILPIGGPLSFIVGGSVPLGVGFGADAETTVGGLGFDLQLSGGVQTRFGYDCQAECDIIGEASRTASALFAPIVPSLGDGVNVALSEKAFGFAELKVGSIVVPDAIKITLLKAAVGLKQSIELAGTEFQRADPLYASSAVLAPSIEIKTGLSLSLLNSLLTVTLVDFSYKPDLPPIASSPTGTFTITPATVVAGDETTLGDSATFTVKLDNVNYLLAYSVEGVELRWYRKDANGNLALQPGRPGCTSLVPTSTGQSEFTCKTDFVVADTGSQTFYAFVKAKIAGASILLPLEIAKEAKAVVTVKPVKVSVTPKTITLAP
jgi:hypothetical protein